MELILNNTRNQSSSLTCPKYRRVRDTLAAPHQMNSSIPHIWPAEIRREISLLKIKKSLGLNRISARASKAFAEKRMLLSLDRNMAHRSKSTLLQLRLQMSLKMECFAPQYSWRSSKLSTAYCLKGYYTKQKIPSRSLLCSTKIISKWKEFFPKDQHDNIKGMWC